MIVGWWEECLGLVACHCLVTMSVDWWGMGNILIFGRMCGVSVKERFSRLFELSVSKWVSVFNMFQLGGGRTERCGSGGGGCLRGKRSMWGNYVYYFKL